MRKLTVTLLGLLLAASAQATSHRTFVAASGTDAGACGPTTPCRSLSYALSQINDGGEIVITQSGGYGDATGGLTINKSVSIIAEPGVIAALAPTTGNGITIATAGVKVVVKGLTINGRGGSNGISMTQGASLLVEKTSIAGFSPGWGLYVQTAATVNVVDAVIHSNSGGIVVGEGATMGVSGSKVLNNSSEGIEIFTSGVGTGATTTLNINDTVVSGSSYCVDNYEITGNTGVINATRVTVTNCGQGFTHSSTSNATNRMMVSDSTASDNTYGFYRNIGTFVSLGNNTVYGNTTNIFGTITPASLQ